MKNSHTPGPWFVKKLANSRLAIADVKLESFALKNNYADPSPICQIIADNREGQDELFNANLIAAAPDLLEALVEAFNICVLQGCTPKSLNDKIVDAIKKARGES